MYEARNVMVMKKIYYCSGESDADEGDTDEGDLLLVEEILTKVMLANVLLTEGVTVRVFEIMK